MSPTLPLIAQQPLSRPATRHTTAKPGRPLLLPIAICVALASLGGCGGGGGGEDTAVSQAVEAPLLFSASAPSAIDGKDGNYLLNTTTGQLFGPKAKGQWPTASIQLTGPQGPVGAAGADGATLLNGSGAPDVALGQNGDFYLNTANQQIYGPKANGAWPASGVSLVGPMGPAGANGVNGTNGNTLLSGTAAPSLGIGAVGDFFIDTITSTLYGPKTSTSWPAGVSLKGAAGATGATGATGPTGAAGANGNSILNGTTLPSNATGVNGDFYLNTTTTTLYGPKAAGAWPSIGVSLVGATGAAGANGTNGTNGTNGNTILNGTGAPASSTGSNGDFYIDTTSTTLYGPKASGAWPSTGVALIGSGGGASGNTLLNGAGAPSNSTGNNGDFYINTSTTTLYGPKLSGVWGAAVSLVGPRVRRALPVPRVPLGQPG